MSIGFLLGAARRGLGLTGLAAIAVFAAAPAQAQFFGGAWAGRFSWAPPVWDDGGPRDEYVRRGFPPGAIFRMLNNQGYHVLGAIRSRGQVYLADVSDAESGQHERLVIDIFTGEVVDAFPLGQRVAPPGRVPLTREREIAVERQPPSAHRPQSHARLTPPAAAPQGGSDDPLVIPGVGAGPSPIRKLKPIPRATAPAKPKPVIARRAPAEQIKRTPVVPAPVTSRPLPPVSASPPAEAVKPDDAPSVATAPPASALPTAPPAAEPAASRPAANDTPPAPLDEAQPAKPKTPVNDIPVAPLE